MVKAKVFYYTFRYTSDTGEVHKTVMEYPIGTPIDEIVRDFVAWKREIVKKVFTLYESDEKGNELE